MKLDAIEMTEDEAIAELTDIYYNVLDNQDDITTRAFAMAIAALETVKELPI